MPNAAAYPNTAVYPNSIQDSPTAPHHHIVGVGLVFSVLSVESPLFGNANRNACHRRNDGGAGNRRCEDGKSQTAFSPMQLN
jgi:hypothetical protein